MNIWIDIWSHDNVWHYSFNGRFCLKHLTAEGSSNPNYKLYVLRGLILGGLISGWHSEQYLWTLGSVFFYTSLRSVTTLRSI